MSAGEIAECLKIVKEIYKRRDAEAFREPVDWQALNLPDYPKVITSPMDLGTIQQRLINGDYRDAFDVEHDMNLVWNNAQTYNQEGTGIHTVAVNLQKLFQKKFDKIEKADPDKKRPSTSDERRQFVEMTKKLTSDQLGDIVGEIEKHCPNALSEGKDDDLEVDVNKIPGRILEQLIKAEQKFVDAAGQRR